MSVYIFLNSFSGSHGSVDNKVSGMTSSILKFINSVFQIFSWCRWWLPIPHISSQLNVTPQKTKPFMTPTIRTKGFKGYIHRVRSCTSNWSDPKQALDPHLTSQEALRHVNKIWIWKDSISVLRRRTFLNMIKGAWWIMKMRWAWMKWTMTPKRGEWTRQLQNLTP